MAAQQWTVDGRVGRLINFVVLKCSGADITPGKQVPAHWARHAPVMASCGIPLVGGTHRLHTVDPELQVEEYLSAMEVIGGYRGRMVHLDCEQGDQVSVRRFLSQFSTRTNRYPVWGYLPDHTEERWADSDLSTYDFGAGWHASEYVTEVLLSGERVQVTGSIEEVLARVTATQWHTWDGVEPPLLQFSSKVRMPGVPGASGFCDANVYRRGDLADLIARSTGMSV